MRIAILSDIHGNVFALEAVLADAKSRGVELMLNLGDILCGPIAPKATYNLLMDHDLVTIRGNQDRLLYEITSEGIKSNPTIQFILDDLGHEPLEWVASLPFDIQLTEEIYICHGSPSDDMTYLLENIESGSACLRSDKEIVELLNGQQSQLILCGHTHTPRSVQLASGQYVVNPGSVGMPAYTDEEPNYHSMENHSPHASYAIIEEKNHDWVIEQMKIPYAFDRAATAAKENGRDDWAHFLSTGKGL